MNKILILVVVVVVVLGAAIYFMSPDSDTPVVEEENGTEEEAVEEVVVTYTEEGYSPDSVTVSPGTQVTFVNESSTSMWPASDIHPTHNIKPEFDPRSPVAENDTYSYIFTREGTWPYHDHLMPGNTGEIIVE